MSARASTPAYEQDVATADGHVFRVRRFAAAPGDRRPGLLFVPALGVPAQKYDRFASALAAYGIDTAVHEWRGGGSSSWRASRRCDWGYRELLADLAATQDALGPVPRVLGGHSLGGQFAAMLGARQPARCAGLALVASGVPYPRTFARGKAIALHVFARLLPPLVGLVGHFPGRRLRFAGREAAGVMRDWAATARTGRYAAYGDGEPAEAALSRLAVPSIAIAMADDWLAPEASLRMLLDKLAPRDRPIRRIEAAGDDDVPADHFAWMRRPETVAACLAATWPAAPAG